MDVDPRKLEFAVNVTVFISVLLSSSLLETVTGVTNQNDFKILNNFRNGLKNPELLRWPAGGNDPCGPPAWPHVFCQNGRVTQIQVQGLGLQGPLPQNFNQLSELQNLGFQNNKFSGDLPTFSGLSNLQYAFLDYNQFSTIPADFFDGLSSIRILALDSNPFNQSSGWMIPSVLAQASELVNFSCSSCNIVGRVPDFFGKLPSLSLLSLAYNRLSGSIPQSFQDSMLQILWLNNQEGGGLTGSIDVIGSMVGLSVVWLHGNSFTGSIPDNIGDLTSLRELRIGTNQLVGLIPRSLANMNLQILDLSNNMFMGPIPKFRAANVSYLQNSFCQSNPGQQCAPEVSALLEFLHDVNYPIKLASQWSGNDPCKGPWWGITCNPSGHVSIINLPKLGLNGPLSASLANLLELYEIHLSRNNLNGTIPVNLTSLRLLRLIDVSGNDFGPPLPRFGKNVIIIIDGNPKLTGGPSKGSPPGSGTAGSPSSDSSNGSSSNGSSSTGHQSRSFKVLVSVVTATGVTVCTFLGLLLGVYCFRKREEKKKAALVKHHKDSSDPGNKVKILAADNSSLEAQNSTSIALSETTDGLANPHVIETGNLVISVQVLCKVTNNFTQENELGRGGFGSVYKGEFEDGTKIAVKRMQAGIISNKALDEFKAEIVVLSSVRHRHLVSLLGYSIEDSERLLVYEYMPKGALSRHLFRWKSLNLEPLSWTSRLQIALDVARGVEYLHSLARQSFIHRDLKSSNILLDDAFRAKVSDFGLVKLAPDKERSVATRLAGTFGYLAPEYAVTGKITTKVDVFSFGVVLMELLTGLVALDEQRPEESRYLVEWFWQRKSNKEKLVASIDPAIDTKEDIYESIYIIAELAGHCTARDPSHRPDMGHVVNALSPLVGQWKPVEETDDYSSFDVTLPLPQMLKGWQEEPTTQDLDLSGTSQDSRGRIASKPSGFADSFTSADAR